MPKASLEGSLRLNPPIAATRGWRGWEARPGKAPPALGRTYLSLVFLPAALPLLSSPSAPACHVLCVCVSVLVRVSP